MGTLIDDTDDLYTSFEDDDEAAFGPPPFMLGYASVGAPCFSATFNPAPGTSPPPEWPPRPIRT